MIHTELCRLKFNMWNSVFLLLFSVIVMAAPGEQSFTPSLIEFWVEKIVLSTEMTSSSYPSGDQLTLYECTTDDCYISLTNNNLLSQLDADLQIKAGSYRYLTVTTCSEEDEVFYAKLKGSVMIDGVNYYTHSTEALLEQTGSVAEQSVTLEFNQCNYYYELQQDAVFSDSVQTPLTLFIDLQNIAWGRNGVEPIESGCFQGVSGSDGVVRSVCLSVPHMIPMNVSEQPTIERFHIYKADSTVDTAGGVLVFYMDDNSQVLGGFSRRLYNETSELPDIPWFDMSIKRMTLLDNGSYEFETYDNNFNSEYLYFPSFSLDSYSRQFYSGEDDVLYEYESEKQ
ncbi:MAG: hypothetical protein VXX85_04850 [Candidatus Margulisiibacteriota bacterium]|nr:hypothetical protein [Candidatus Margulisiibacteriota bacterium]